MKAEEEIYIININDSLAYNTLPVTTQGFRFAVDTSKEGNIKKIYSVGGLKPGLEIFNYNSNNYVEKTFYPLNANDADNNTLSFYQALIENDSIIWLLSARKGLVKFNINRPYEPIVPFLPENYNRLSGQASTWVSENNILIASHGNGLFLFDSHKNKFIHRWNYSFDDQTSLASDNLIGLYFDFQKDLWVAGQNSGVDFTSFNALPTITNCIPKQPTRSSRVNFIVEDQLKRIWIGTQSQGVYLVDQKGIVIKHFPFSSISNDFEGLQYLSIDHGNRAWCLTRKAIYFFNNKLDRWEKVNVDTKDLELLYIQNLKSGKTIISTSRANASK